ncbi:hypothetical protein [Sphingomonas faeni]|uniref:hypothetical protein n=1 Tax=Sphingomonas faeni TaxID=185950 RepID=UPI003355A102
MVEAGRAARGFASPDRRGDTVRAVVAAVDQRLRFGGDAVVELLFERFVRRFIADLSVSV